MLGDYMHDGAFPLQMAGDPQQSPADDGAAESFIHFRPDNDIADTCFIFERHKYHARCGSGALAGDDQPADREWRQRGCSKLSMRRRIAQIRPQQLDRMRFERQAQGEVIFNDFFTEVHCGQVNLWFGYCFPVHGITKERQRAV